MRPFEKADADSELAEILAKGIDGLLDKKRDHYSIGEQGQNLSKLLYEFYYNQIGQILDVEPGETEIPAAKLDRLRATLYYVFANIEALQNVDDTRIATLASRVASSIANKYRQGVEPEHKKWKESKMLVDFPGLEGILTRINNRLSVLGDTKELLKELLERGFDKLSPAEQESYFMTKFGIARPVAAMLVTIFLATLICGNTSWSDIKGKEIEVPQSPSALMRRAAELSVDNGGGQDSDPVTLLSEQFNPGSKADHIVPSGQAIFKVDKKGNQVRVREGGAGKEDVISNRKEFKVFPSGSTIEAIKREIRAGKITEEDINTYLEKIIINQVPKERSAFVLWLKNSIGTDLKNLPEFIKKDLAKDGLRKGKIAALILSIAIEERESHQSDATSFPVDITGAYGGEELSSVIIMGITDKGVFTIDMSNPYLPPTQ